MPRVKPDKPSGDVPAPLADVINRRRSWPTHVEIFAAIADAYDCHDRSVAWAAEQLGLKREQVYRDYWTPYRASYEALIDDGLTHEAAIERIAADVVSR